METISATQPPTGVITLESITEAITNMGWRMGNIEGQLATVKGSVSRIDERMINEEGRVNSTNSTPQATFRASTSGHDHTNSPTITPETFHQTFSQTPIRFGFNVQNPNRPFQPPFNQEVPPNQAPLNKNPPYQMPQTQPISLIEERNDGYQGRYEGEGEEAPWNEAPRNQPRGQMGWRTTRSLCQSRVGQELRKGHGNQYQVEAQRGYYNHDQGGNGGRDVGINSIKISLPYFKGECNPDAYLEWESLWYAITWWEYMKRYHLWWEYMKRYHLWWEYMTRYHLVVQDGHPPPWTGLKALIRVKYVPERFRQELLAKLYNLRQGSKSVVAYYDEIRNLILKLEYAENECHDPKLDVMALVLSHQDKSA
ncbi:hypothetical protein KY284_010879 [Solanum tuberosum]|nr:hypothetical protein KY284_010879 [Solanum tuberosum]